MREWGGPRAVPFVIGGRFIATTRIESLHAGKKRTVGKAIRDIIDYVENPQKTDGGRLISSFQCDSRIADAQFLFDKRQYLAKTGRRRGADDVIAYAIRQSFVPGEITPEEANRLGCELARRFTKGNHAYIVCTHIDRHHIHNHIIWNSTSLDHSRKFRDFLGSGRAVRRLSDTICIENGYSIVEHPKGRGRSYDKWLGTKPPCHRDRLRMIIDAALAQKPADLDGLLKLLGEAGIEVSPRGKAIRLRAPGQKKFVRLDADSLGAEYDIPALLDVLAGKRTHTSGAKNVHWADPPKVNLLVDIQAKLQAGKGAGYARWASVFNLKQMAQTMNYLTEHGLLDYADLKAKAADASARYAKLSGKIKASERRMAEIAVLKTHIINYSKTRAVYKEYKKSRHKKEYRAAHADELAKHEAAKAAFDALAGKPIPKVAQLSEEYAALLAEKKACYEEYKAARKEMVDYQTAKHNVDIILGLEPQEVEKKKETER